MASTFEISGECVKVKRLDKVTFVTMKTKSFFDIKIFDFDVAAQCEPGLQLTVGGEIGMRKPKAEGGKWELQLVARRVRVDGGVPINAAAHVAPEEDTSNIPF